MSVRGAAWLLFVCAHQCVCAPVSTHCSGSVGACIGVNNLTPGTLLPGLQQLMLICRCQVSSLHYVRCQLTFANVATWLIIASSQHWMSQWGYSGPHSWWRRLVNAGINFGLFSTWNSFFPHFCQTGWPRYSTHSHSYLPWFCCI